MKTFDEAMQLLCRDKVSGEEADVTLDSMTNEVEKRVSVAEEIVNSQRAQAFIMCYVQEIPGQFGSMEEFALSVFINGVLVGMEMEKTEL